MKLENEFTVPASIDDAWAVLLDIPRVAPCLPGATVEPGGDDGTYNGTMKVKIGPISASYKGTVKIEERRRVRPPRRDARAGQGRARPGHRGGDDHLDDGGDARGHEGARRDRHAHHRRRGPVRARRDAGRQREDDEALRGLPGARRSAAALRRPPRPRRPCTAAARAAGAEATVGDAEVPSASSGVSSAEAERPRRAPPPASPARPRRPRRRARPRTSWTSAR